MEKVFKVFLWIFAALAISMVTGCSENDEPVPTPPDDPVFTLEVLQVGLDSVEFRITPTDETLTYIAMIALQEELDLYTEMAWIADDLAWFEYRAGESGISLEEFLSQNLRQGVLTDSIDGLDPGTDYYLYAYALNTKGTPLSTLHKLAFTTETVDKVELDFEISVSNITYNSADLSVIPDSKQAKYFVNVMSEADYNDWGGTEEAFVSHLLGLRAYYLGMGATIEQMVGRLSYVGDKDFPFSKLTAGTNYIAYAIGVSDDFYANSEATIERFSTPAADMSDLTFEVDITDLGYDRISATITPSNNTESYICCLALAESLNRYGSEQEFMESLVSDMKDNNELDKVLYTGVLTKDFTGLYPHTDYILVCFGYDETPTTALYSTPFTTAEADGDPEKLIVDFEIVDVTHNSMTVKTIPSVGVYYFVSYTDAFTFDETVQELGSEDAAIQQLANGDIDYGAEWFDLDRATYLLDLGATVGTYNNFFNQLTPSTDYVVYAVAVDINSGELASTKGFASDPIRTLEKVYSQAKVTFVFDKYYDGTELAQKNPEKYHNCMGYAVLPYTIQTNEEAMCWYTGFYSGDYTEWGCSDDDIYTDLITYGYEIGSESVAFNQESGLAILNYDMPFSFLGIAQDSDNEYGHGTLQVVTLTKEGVSPVDDFLASKGELQSAASLEYIKTNKKPVVREQQSMLRVPKVTFKETSAPEKKETRKISHKRFILG